MCDFCRREPDDEPEDPRIADAEYEREHGGDGTEWQLELTRYERQIGEQP